jgi:CBS domain-containing protein
MATVGDILANRRHQIVSVDPSDSALYAASLMNKHKVGSLLVMRNETMIGIITERDLLQRVLAGTRDPATTCVVDVMTADVLCCRPKTTIEEARTVMKNRRIRHLPVVDDHGCLHGLVSIGDLNAYDAHSQELTIHFMNDMIFARCASAV